MKTKFLILTILLVTITGCKNENHSKLKSEPTIQQDQDEIALSKCNTNEINFVLNRVKNHKHAINEKDAYILIENNCTENVEYSQIRNELIYEVLKIKPESFINIFGSFKKQYVERFLSEMENPLSDKVDLDNIIQQISKIDQSKHRDMLIRSLELAKAKEK